MEQTLGPFDPQRLVDMGFDFGPKLLAALLVLLVFWIVLRVTQPPLRSMLKRAEFADALVGLLIDNVYKFALMGFGFIMAASQLGINIGAALAGLGVAGLAIGFAAQDSVANTIAGFLIFWDKPFQVGHFVTTQSEYGQVTDITMRTTRIRTPRNIYLVVPNRKIIEDVLVNHSMYGHTRVDVPLGIAYKEDIDAAREVLLRVARTDEHVSADPPPEVVVTELGNSSVNLQIRVWIDDAKLERPVLLRVLEGSKKALDQAGIEIPFPHLQLFFDDIRKPAVEKMQLIAGGQGT
ncbi:MAG: mechanosensitive ion channel family protein [Gemmatimonadota bacterium]|nr:mechanosensitive ion channel family protein [Gemmatimonadota bacterium]